MSAAAATLTVQRDTVYHDCFLISLSGFHYEGEGRIVNREQLEAVLGESAASILIDQIEAAS